MTIKTPAQVAQDLYWTLSDFPVNPKGSDLRDLMTKAIEADRAQRTEHPEPVESAFQVGDLVRLTGKDWMGDMSGAEVVITGHDQDGDPQFMFDGEGPYSIWDAGTYLGDFTATLVRLAGE